MHSLRCDRERFATSHTVVPDSRLYTRWAPQGFNGRPGGSINSWLWKSGPFYTMGGTRKRIFDDSRRFARSIHLQRDLDLKTITEDISVSPLAHVVADNYGNSSWLTTWEQLPLDVNTFPSRNGGVWTGKFLNACYSGLDEADNDHQPDFLLANFLLELDELPGLIANLASLLRLIGSRRSMREFSRDFFAAAARDQTSGHGPGTRLSSAVDVIAGQHLSTSFGVVPTIQDLQAIANLGRSIGSRLDNLRATNNAIFAFRRGMKITDPAFRYSRYPSWGPPAQGLDFPGTWFPLRLQPVEWSQKYTVKGWVRRSLQGLDGALAPLSASLEAMGLNRFGEIFWEAIPFSFVLDYFLGIGHLVKSIKFSPWTGSETLLGCTFGVKTEATYALEAATFEQVGAYPYPSLGFSKWVPVGNVKTMWRLRYGRWPFQLTDYVDVRPPTPKQMLCLGALSRG